MNYSMIAYILGWVTGLQGVLMIPSVIAGLIFREPAVWSLAGTAALCLVLGAPVLFKKPKEQGMYAREGFVIVGLSWLVLSVLGCLPFVFAGAIPSFIDALFETVSGFTTTGASILENVEAMPKCLLFWRSFTHWIGGMGVLVFLLTILPMAGGTHMNLMKAESPGPSGEKLLPRVSETAKILYLMYLGLTIVEIILLLLGRMPLFDALCLSFGTAGTGGFGVRNDSVASYGSYAQWVITIFMLLFGVNFSIYFLLLHKRVKQALSSEELHGYAIIVGAAILFIFLQLVLSGTGGKHPLLEASFQVASIITTTGYSTVDFNQWPAFSRTILVTLMLVGACAGSTGGGFKVSRALLFFKSIRRQLFFFLHPTGVRRVTLDGHAMDRQTMRAVTSFAASYMAILIVSVLLVSLEGYSETTNLTAVIACFNNIGPGLDLVGPAANFHFFNPFTKLVLIFDMLAGRLEIFPLLLLFYPRTWRRH